MSHIALYRKYRPTTFNDMIGQKHIIDILKKQIITGKISHAYIFSGTRGTGKTSAAKIFARAINCTNSVDGEPCNECEACKSILSGDSTDVVEMDAASNNSVENIRSIRQEVIYASTQVKYKVYIIDEAHMLSTSAFNALLKTLEEPPEDVVFILATTEEHKILPTILSRCIRFEFKKLTEKDIADRLKYVLKDYDIEYEENALNIIAGLADGALRDALSILERCINNQGGTLTATKVQDIVGIVQKELIENLLKGILDYNVTATNTALNDIIQKGKDLRYCLSQMIDQALNLIIYLSGDKSNILSDTFKNVIDKVTIYRLNYILKNLTKLDDELRQTSNPSVIFKAKMFELAIGPKLENSQDILSKIEQLEMKVEQINVSSVAKEPAVILAIEEAKKEGIEKIEKIEKIENPKIKEKTEELPNAIVPKKEFKLLGKVIAKAEESDSPRLCSALSGIKAYVDQDCINFVTDNSFSFGLLKNVELKNELTSLVQEVSGKDLEVTVDFKKQEEVTNEFEKLFDGMGVPFTNID